MPDRSKKTCRVSSSATTKSWFAYTETTSSVLSAAYAPLTVVIKTLSAYKAEFARQGKTYECGWIEAFRLPERGGRRPEPRAPQLPKEEPAHVNLD